MGELLLMADKDKAERALHLRLKAVIESRCADIHEENVKHLKNIKEWCDGVIEHDTYHHSKFDYDSSLGAIEGELKEIHEGRGAIAELWKVVKAGDQYA